VRPDVVNLGFDGETSGSFFTGIGNFYGPEASLMNTNYSPPVIQNEMMLGAIASAAAAGNPVGYVTVSLGANDLFQLLADPNFFSLPPEEQQAIVMATLQGVQNNLATLLFELRSSLPTASIYLMGYYNPFAVFAGTPIGDLTTSAIQGLNMVIGGIAGAFDATYIDTYTPFLGHEAEYTYILTEFQGVPNVHPNDLGYSVIGQQLTAAVPEPRIVEFSRNRDLYMRKHHGRLTACSVRLLTAWTYALRAAIALVLPGHSAKRYWRHVTATLCPGNSEGLRETADHYNRGGPTL